MPPPLQKNTVHTLYKYSLIQVSWA